MRPLLRILGFAVNLVLVLVIGAGLFFGLTSRRSPDGIPTIGGYKILSVLSGSMEPAIHTGDVIVIKPLAPTDEVHENDVITYRVNDKSNMMITHRVVGILKANGEPAAYSTKGDANKGPDLSLVTPDKIVGRFQWRVIYFGYLADFIHKPAGVALFVILPGLVLIGLEFRNLWRGLNEAEKEKEAQKAAQQERGGE